MLATAAALGARGIEVARFNFPYRERKSRRPDAMPALRSAFESAVAHARYDFPRHKLIIGGRSMGGRVATMLAADDFACDGLLLFAYPLHPAGQPEKLRDAHLPRIKAPVLCFNGTRDALCKRDLMERALTRRLELTELAGGTFTVTNLGMYPVDFFAPVINHPQIAVLAIGRVRRAAVVKGDQISPEWSMWANLAVDHRAADGATAAQFLRKLEQSIEALPTRI